MLCLCVSSFPSLPLLTFAHALGDSVPFSSRRSSVFSASNPNWKRVALSDHPGNVFILLVDIGKGGKKRVGVYFFPVFFFFFKPSYFHSSFSFRFSNVFNLCGP